MTISLVDKILFLIVLIVHVGVGLLGLFMGEMTGYFLFGLWEYPFFALIQNIAPIGSPHDFRNIIVLLCGGMFWASFVVICRMTIKRVRGRFQTGDDRSRN